MSKHTEYNVKNENSTLPLIFTFYLDMMRITK